MTSVVGITTPGGLWLMVDRRLSRLDGVPEPGDNAIKLLDYSTPDGCALIGYTGVGRTPGGTQPSEWMSRVLRGHGVDLHKGLGILGYAFKNDFVPIARKMGVGHGLVIPSLRNGKPEMWVMELAHSMDKRRWFFRAKCHQHTKWEEFGQSSPFFFVGGEGGLRIKNELLALRPVLKACDSGKVSPKAVAFQLGRVNKLASERATGVSARSIVVWRRVRGNSGHIFFDGEREERRQSSSAVVAPGSEIRLQMTEALPTIANGIDVKAVVGAMEAAYSPWRFDENGQPTFPELDEDEARESLARIPTHPDRSLD